MRTRKSAGHSPQTQSRSRNTAAVSSDEAEVARAIAAALDAVAVFDSDLAKTLKGKIKGKRRLHYKPS